MENARETNFLLLSESNLNFVMFAWSQVTATRAGHRQVTGRSRAGHGQVTGRSRAHTHSFFFCSGMHLAILAHPPTPIPHPPNPFPHPPNIPYPPKPFAFQYMTWYQIVLPISHQCLQMIHEEL